MEKHLHTFFNSVLDGKGYSYASRHVNFDTSDDPRFKRLFQKAGGKAALTAHFCRNRMVLWDTRIFTSLYINDKHCMVALCADTSNTEFALHLRDHSVGDTVVLTRMHADRYSDHYAHMEKHDLSYNGCLVTVTDIDQGYLTVRTREGCALRVTESQVAHKLATNVVEDLLGHIMLLVSPVDDHWVTCQACGADLGSKSWVPCAECGERTYCNRECAVNGWSQHKLWCTNVKRNVCSFCLERFPIDARRRLQCPCRQVYYCGKQCQKKDWKTHKLSCFHRR